MSNLREVRRARRARSWPYAAKACAAKVAPAGGRADSSIPDADELLCATAGGDPAAALRVLHGGGSGAATWISRGIWRESVTDGSEKKDGSTFSPGFCTHRCAVAGFLRGLTRRLRREWWDCRPQRAVLSFDAKRKHQRKQAARRLQRRPTSLCTAAKPCAAPGLGYALHGFQPFLALVGLRPPLAVGFESAGTERLDDPKFFGSSNCRPKGRNSLITFREQTALQRLSSSTGSPVSASLPAGRSARLPPSLRVALGCAQGPTGATLPFGTVRCAHPPGKSPLLPHFAGGARNVARDIVGELSPSFVRAPVLAFFRRQNGRAFFPPLPIAALLPRRWLWLGSNSGAWDVTMQLVLQRRKKDSAFSQ